MRPLNDPEAVRQEYANEARLEVRTSIYDGAEGPNPIELLFELVIERSPRRVLEVGCGTGKLAARLSRECDLRAIDISPRMVELTRARGVDADVADVQELPFEDGEFDVAIAAWVLFHVPDLAGGLSELARVLRPGGALLAVTNGADHLRELWALIGENTTRAFSAENGGELLSRHFSAVEAVPVRGSVSLPDRESVRRYVAASFTRPDLADRVPKLAEPMRATTHQAIFVATV